MDCGIYKVTVNTEFSQKHVNRANEKNVTRQKEKVFLLRVHKKI